MNVPPLAALFLSVLALLGAAQADDEAPVVSELELARARAALSAAGEHLAETRYLRADYVQTRTSLLLFEPIVSSGALLYRREPGCLVFDVQAPRRTRIRLDASTYQVHRPALGQAERFLFESNELGRALLATFSPEIAQLETRFHILAAPELPDELGTRVVLRPRSDELRHVLARLELDLRPLPVDPETPAGPARAELVALRYLDKDGDEVEIALAAIEHDPEWEQPDPYFSRELPSGTQVIEHRIAPPSQDD